MHDWVNKLQIDSKINPVKGWKFVNYYVSLDQKIVWNFNTQTLLFLS